MTLQNGALIGQKALLWTDTAYFRTEDGALLFHDSKAICGLEWPFAVSWSLVGPDQGKVFRYFGTAEPNSVPELLNCCREALQQFCKPSGAFGRLMVAAYDQVKRSPRLFLISSTPMLDYPAYAPMEGISFVSSHTETPAYQAALRSGFTISRMLDVIDAQYTTPFLTVIGTEVTASGNCVQIEVGPKGVATSVARKMATAQ